MTVSNSPRSSNSLKMLNAPSSAIRTASAPNPAPRRVERFRSFSFIAGILEANTFDHVQKRSETVSDLVFAAQLNALPKPDSGRAREVHVGVVDPVEQVGEADHRDDQQRLDRLLRRVAGREHRLQYRRGRRAARRVHRADEA